MNIHDFAESGKVSLRQIMDFTSDVNPIGPSNRAKHAIRKGAKDLVFPPDEKLRHLKRYLCKRERVEEDSVLFGQGVHHILLALSRAVRPTTVALLPPASRRYREFLAGHNLEIANAPATKDWGSPIDIEDFIKSAKDADMLVVANPHDLTGRTLPAGALIALVEEMDRLDKTLVIDETYIEFTEAVSPLSRVVSSHGAMIIRSFSLFHALAGLPIAYGIGPARLIEMVKSHVELPQISSLAALAAHASLKDKGYRKRTLQFIAEEKKFIIDGLKKLGRVDATDTPCNFLVLKIDGAGAGLKTLLEKRTIMIDEYDDGNGNVWLKFPIKSHKFNARFIKAMKSVTEQSG